MHSLPRLRRARAIIEPVRSLTPPTQNVITQPGGPQPGICSLDILRDSRLDVGLDHGHTLRARTACHFLAGAPFLDNWGPFAFGEIQLDLVTINDSENAS